MNCAVQRRRGVCPSSRDVVDTPLLESIDLEIRRQHCAQTMLVVVDVRDAALVTADGRERVFGDVRSSSVARVMRRRKRRVEKTAGNEHARDRIDALGDALRRPVEQRVRCEYRVETIAHRADRLRGCCPKVVDRRHREPRLRQRNGVAAVAAAEVENARMRAIAEALDEVDGERMCRHRREYSENEAAC